MNSDEIRHDDGMFPEEIRDDYNYGSLFVDKGGNVIFRFYDENKERTSISVSHMVYHHHTDEWPEEQEAIKHEDGNTFNNRMENLCLKVK